MTYTWWVEGKGPYSCFGERQVFVTGWNCLFYWPMSFAFSILLISKGGWNEKGAIEKDELEEIGKTEHQNFNALLYLIGSMLFGVFWVTWSCVTSFWRQGRRVVSELLNRSVLEFSESLIGDMFSSTVSLFMKPLLQRPRSSSCPERKAVEGASIMKSHRRKKQNRTSSDFTCQNTVKGVGMRLSRAKGWKSENSRWEIETGSVHELSRRCGVVMIQSRFHYLFSCGESFANSPCRTFC